MRPLEHIMTITQSQHLKPLDSSQDLKHAQQTQLLSDQNTKQKESVSKISTDTQSELTNGVKNGLGQSNSNLDYQEDHFSSNQHHDDKVTEKEILDENHGKNIDVIC
ncbi:MAG: hypothetical protein ACRCTJ_07325 [Brevinema sp.]